MSDKPGKPSIPSWQRAQTAAPPPPTVEQEYKQEKEPESSAEPGAEESTKDESQPDSQLESTSFLDQVSRFLQDPTIRDAPREKKVAFLQSKGVGMEDIDRLLGPAQEDKAAVDISKEGERVWSKTPSQTPASAPKPQPREIPPIVTYPEFLTQSTKPPPLITTRRLLNTAYITGGLIATMYGLSKYIVAPMTETLAESRHDFASHTQTQLDNLNARLKNIVSIDPANNPKPKAAEIIDDISEADSDPTELFHRDFGTQTTPSLSRRPSVTDTPETPSAITGHENRLKVLTSHLRELGATRSNDTASSESLKTQLSDLNSYLSEMSYQNSYYGGMGGLYGGNYGVPKGKDGKDDQIDVLKADIRAVKGVLLSARNFPAGGPWVGRVGG
ncbi:hypothetical protein K469DRAFT_721631 [Zopfia rhizophila CBS 207.26]|uniref:Peroxisomal membrane protein PEX14 n=1 Tax=Zopfia rhizophila CBS 207.26 TaxID=1314779 RepID=A0A6A6EIL5_9PEZI|nr:hypothetical protein K469DRAFT_721631 [Zopfia rhizophila CBS 207.26]